jgi:hypothetical protein
MFTIEQVSQKFAEFQEERISLEEFENWFEDNSNGAYADPAVSRVFAAVESAFSQYYFDHIGENAMRVELAKAIHPFESPKPLRYSPSPAFAKTSSEGYSANQRMVLRLGQEAA